MRAYTFNQALQAGKQPRDYSAEGGAGHYIGTLEFKMWGRSDNLRCFFTLDTGDKVVLSAFTRGPADFEYCARDGRIDFSEPGIEGQSFEIEVAANGEGRPSWLSAVRLVGHPYTSENAVSGWR